MTRWLGNMIHPMIQTIFSLFTTRDKNQKILTKSYLLAASLEPHEHRGHAGLSVHQSDLLPELRVLEHALLVQLNPLLQYAWQHRTIRKIQEFKGK